MSISEMNKIMERFDRLEARIRALEQEADAKAQRTLTLPKPKETAHA